MAAAPEARAAPWLSVLVAACDVAPYIEATLHSVLGQADGGVEVVVVDDASSDDTAARVARVAAADARLRLVANTTNRGVAAVRGQLLAEARGEYAWFLDGDDLLAPGAIAGAGAQLRHAPVDLLVCDFRTLGGPPWARRRRSTFDRRSRGSDRGALVAGSLGAGQLHVWSRIARVALWRQVRFPPLSRFEDMAAVAQLLLAARDWRHVAAPWVRYRQRAGSLSHAVPAGSLLEYATALSTVASVLRGDPCVAGARGAVDYFLLRGQASIARRLRRMGAAPRGLRDACRREFLALFPDAGRETLRWCRRQGWWLRAWRIARALDHAGWRALSRD